MLTMECNYADDVAAQREAAFGARRNEGRAEAVRRMAGCMSLTFAQVMDVLKIEPSALGGLASLL